MKILIPIGSFYPSQQGGPSNSMYWISSALEGKGFNITVVSSDAMLSESVPRNQWHKFPYGKVIYCKTKWHKFPFTAMFHGLLAIRKTDIVHLNSVFYPFSLIMAIGAILMNKKIVWSTRGELYPNALRYSGWSKRLYLKGFRTVFSRNAIFHTTTSPETENARLILGEKCQMVEIPNYMILPKGIDTEKKRYISFIGRIHPIKALDRLILACKFSQSFMESDWELRIAGDFENNYGQKLLQLIDDEKLKEKVILVGHVEGNDKEKFLAQSSFNFLISDSENFGLVVIESLAQGTPVVASKGTPWESLETNQAGFWVNNDVESLRSIIDKILTMDDVHYQEMSLNALRLSEQYDISEHIHEWVDFYKSLDSK
ncbi:MAG: glycosyltransferase family 4 protein [Chitinophagales bacterium]|nr:glycosyltransferase family 4 protein [Chitinophagales bacterium]